MIQSKIITRESEMSLQDDINNFCKLHGEYFKIINVSYAINIDGSRYNYSALILYEVTKGEEEEEEEEDRDS